MSPSDFDDFSTVQVPLWPWQYHHFTPPGHPDHSDLFYCHPSKRCESCRRRHSIEEEPPSPHSVLQDFYNRQQWRATSSELEGGCRAFSYKARFAEDEGLCAEEDYPIKSFDDMEPLKYSHTSQDNSPPVGMELDNPPSPQPVHMNICKIFPDSSCYICSSFTDDILLYCHGQNGAQQKSEVIMTFRDTTPTPSSANNSSDTKGNSTCTPSINTTAPPYNGSCATTQNPPAPSTGKQSNQGEQQQQQLYQNKQTTHTHNSENTLPADSLYSKSSFHMWPQDGKAESGCGQGSGYYNESQQQQQNMEYQKSQKQQSSPRQNTWKKSASLPKQKRGGGEVTGSNPGDQGEFTHSMTPVTTMTHQQNPGNPGQLWQLCPSSFSGHGNPEQDRSSTNCGTYYHPGNSNETQYYTYSSFSTHEPPLGQMYSNSNVPPRRHSVYPQNVGPPTFPQYLNFPPPPPPPPPAVNVGKEFSTAPQFSMQTISAPTSETGSGCAACTAEAKAQFFEQHGSEDEAEPELFVSESVHQIPEPSLSLGDLEPPFLDGTSNSTLSREDSPQRISPQFRSDAISSSSTGYFEQFEFHDASNLPAPLEVELEVVEPMEVEVQEISDIPLQPKNPSVLKISSNSVLRKDEGMRDTPNFVAKVSLLGNKRVEIPLASIVQHQSTVKIGKCKSDRKLNESKKCCKAKQRPFLLKERLTEKVEDKWSRGFNVVKQSGCIDFQAKMITTVCPKKNSKEPNCCDSIKTPLTPDAPMTPHEWGSFSRDDEKKERQSAKLLKEAAEKLKKVSQGSVPKFVESAEGSPVKEVKKELRLEVEGNEEFEPEIFSQEIPLPLPVALTMAMVTDDSGIEDLNDLLPEPPEIPATMESLQPDDEESITSQLAHLIEAMRAAVDSAGLEQPQDIHLDLLCPIEIVENEETGEKMFTIDRCRPSFLMTDCIGLDCHCPGHGRNPDSTGNNEMDEEDTEIYLAALIPSNMDDEGCTVRRVRRRSVPVPSKQVGVQTEPRKHRVRTIEKEREKEFGI